MKLALLVVGSSVVIILVIALLAGASTAAAGMGLVSLVVFQLLCLKSLRGRSLRHLVLPIVIWRVLLLLAITLWFFPYYSEAGVDAQTYHAWADSFAEQLRTGQIGDLPNGSGMRSMVILTAVLYFPFGSDLYGAIAVWAVLGFASAIYFYKAFALWHGPELARRYALLIFFFPSFGLWSTTGKDCWVVFGLALVSYGYAKSVARFSINAAAHILIGLLLNMAVRPQIAVFLTIAICSAELLRKKRLSGVLAFRVAVVLAVMIPILLVAGSVWQQLSGFKDYTFSSLLDLGMANSRGNATGGSSDEVIEVTNLSDFLRILPFGVTRFLFRPFLWEVQNVNAGMAAAENVIMISLMFWFRKTLWRSIRSIREQPYLIFCLVFCVQVILVCSLIPNLGLLSRLKAQVLPFMFAILASGSLQTVRVRLRSRNEGIARMVQQRVSHLDPNAV